MTLLSNIELKIAEIHETYEGQTEKYSTVTGERYYNAYDDWTDSLTKI